jgi:hypothetical protein
MPLVTPLPLGVDAEVAELANFFTTTLGFPPNSVLTMQRRPEIARAFRRPFRLGPVRELQWPSAQSPK